jgi:hypothetical protein
MSARERYHQVTAQRNARELPALLFERVIDRRSRKSQRYARYWNSDSPPDRCRMAPAGQKARISGSAAQKGERREPVSFRNS